MNVCEGTCEWGGMVVGGGDNHVQSLYGHDIVVNKLTTGVEPSPLHTGVNLCTASCHGRD